MSRSGAAAEAADVGGAPEPSSTPLGGAAKSELRAGRRYHRPSDYLRYVTAGVLAGVGASVCELVLFFAPERAPLPPAMGEVALASFAVYCQLGALLSSAVWLAYWSALRLMTSESDAAPRQQIALRAVLGAVCVAGLAVTLGRVLAFAAPISAPIRRAAAMTFGGGGASLFWLVVFHVLVRHSMLVLFWARRLLWPALALGVFEFCSTAWSAWRLSYDYGPYIKLLAYGFGAPALLFALRPSAVPLLAQRALCVSALLGSAHLWWAGISPQAIHTMWTARTQVVALLRELPAELMSPSEPSLGAAIKSRISMRGVRAEQPRRLRGAGVELGTPPDIILLTIDTLRQDRVGAGPGVSAPMSQLASFAGTATTYTHAFSAAGATVGSLSQLLSGSREHVLSHLAVPRGAMTRLDPTTATVAARLARAGYSTEAALGGIFPSYFPSAALGFDSVAVRGDEPLRASDVVDVLARAPTDGAPPSFRWGHIMEVHDFAVGSSDLVRDYDAAVRAVDRELGRLFRELERTPRGRSTLVAVTSDHGEGLGEGHLIAHGVCHPLTLAVPLIVRFPGQTAASSVAASVGHLDVAPTLLAAAGLDASDLLGRDLATVSPQERPDASLALFECGSYSNEPQPSSFGVASYPWLYVYNVELGKPLLIDVEHDPFGLANLAGQGMPEERRLVQALRASMTPRTPSVSLSSAHGLADGLAPR